MRRVLIAAHTEVGGAPLALQSVYFPTLVGAYARAIRGRAQLIVAVPASVAPELGARLSVEGSTDGVTLVEELPAEAPGDLRFGLEEVHQPSALRAACGRPDVGLEAPVWRIREPADIARAAATLERHDMYVVARHLVIPVARRLAHALQSTFVTPNQVTALSCLCGVLAAVAPFSFAGWTGRIAAALLVHLSVTLDFTDGYLARLRAADSRTGYWFDTLMDEVVKFSLFSGMGAMALRSGAPWAIGATVLVLLLYHVLTTNHWLSKSLEQGDVTASAAVAARWRPGLAGIAQRAFERLNYLDVHLYLIAVSMLTATESWMLLLFACVYLLRFVRMLQVRLAPTNTVEKE
jgi:phosphatidylglycerophosphate synthase